MAILLKAVKGVKHDGTRRLNDLLVYLLSKWLRQARIPHMGGVGGFKHIWFVNQLPKLDLKTPPMPRNYGTDRASSPSSCLALRRSTSPGKVAKVLGDRTLSDMKTLAPGAA